MELVKIMKALGDETRLRIMNLLKDGELCVCQIESILGINQSNASRHLNKLVNAGLISNYKKAQYVYYKLDYKALEEHPFLDEMIKNELNKVEQHQKDTEKLMEYKKRNITCEDIKKGILL